MTLMASKFYACEDIDQAAGMARLRYITDVAGQQATYLVKLQQGQDYLAARQANPDAPVPPYVAAEAAAVGATPQVTAQTWVDVAAQWNNQLGPSIEAARVGGKAQVNAAQTDSDVQAARAAAIAALNAI